MNYSGSPNTGFHWGQWYRPDWVKWCGRCKVEAPRHTHLNPIGTDQEARLQVIYTGLPTVGIVP